MFLSCHIRVYSESTLCNYQDFRELSARNIYVIWRVSGSTLNGWVFVYELSLNPLQSLLVIIHHTLLWTSRVHCRVSFTKYRTIRAKNTCISLCKTLLWEFWNMSRKYLAWAWFLVNSYFWPICTLWHF